MRTFEEIRKHELKESYLGLLYLAAFLIATAIVVASLMSSLSA